MIDEKLVIMFFGCGVIGITTFILWFDSWLENIMESVNYE